jgi:UDP-3-O-[3-hydroxymyristoyl] glucosamine N-acyltransferase
MAERRLTAGAIAALVGGELVGPPDVTVAGAASLSEAGPSDVTFLTNGRWLAAMAASHADLVLLPPPFRDAAGPISRIVVADPRAAIVAVLDALQPTPQIAWGVDPTARIGRGCRWEGRVAVAAGAALGDGVRLGRDCRVEAGAVLGAGVILGDGCRVGSHALIASGATLGHRTVVKAGARIGTDGFAWLDHGGGRRRVPHAGACRIGNDVEIGANATVDRGSLDATVIGDGTKIDNLVHIAHNVRIGRRCMVLAQVGIAGTTVVGDDVEIGGQAGLAGQLSVGARARLAAQSGVIGDIAAGATVSGYPARDHRAVLRQAAALARLAPLVTTLERMTRDHADRD